MVDLTGKSRALVLRILVAFACIYFIWGSTFLAIRIAVADLPPFLMCGARLLIAGAVMLLIAWSRRSEWPRGIEWRNAALVGLMLPAAGNGAVTLAETRVPSGLVALLVATIPLWMALLSAFGPAPVPLRARTLVGLVFGLVGIGLLIGPGVLPHGASLDPRFAVLPVLGSISWAYGSLWSRRVAQPRSPLAGTGVGLVAGGLVLLVIALVAGEGSRVDVAQVRPQAWAALGYLSIFGTVITFTAYLWLLGAVPPTAVSTYAFVNPVVAMALGWAFAGEALTGRVAIAAALVVLAVVLIVTSKPVAARRVAREDTCSEAARAG